MDHHQVFNDSDEFLLTFDDPSMKNSGRIPIDLTPTEKGLGRHCKQIRQEDISTEEMEVHVIEPRDIIVDLTETSDEEEEEEALAAPEAPAAPAAPAAQEKKAVHPHAATFAILKKYKHAFGSQDEDSQDEDSQNEDGQDRDSQNKDSKRGELVTGMGGFSKKIKKDETPPTQVQTRPRKYKSIGKCDKTMRLLGLISPKKKKKKPATPKYEDISPAPSPSTKHLLDLVTSAQPSGTKARRELFPTDLVPQPLVPQPQPQEQPAAVQPQRDLSGVTFLEAELIEPDFVKSVLESLEFELDPLPAAAAPEAPAAFAATVQDEEHQPQPQPPEEQPVGVAVQEEQPQPPEEQPAAAVHEDVPQHVDSQPAAAAQEDVPQHVDSQPAAAAQEEGDNFPDLLTNILNELGITQMGISPQQDVVEETSLLLTPTISPQSSTTLPSLNLESVRTTLEPERPEGSSVAATASAAELSETDRAVADLLEAISVAAETTTPQAVAPTQRSPICSTPTPPTHPPTSSSTAPPPGQKNVFLPPLQATLPPLDLLKTPRHTTDSFLWPQHPVSAENTKNNGSKKVRAEKRKNNEKVTHTKKKKKNTLSEEQIRYQKIKEDIRRKLNELEMQNE